MEHGFRGFLRIKVDFDATKPLVAWISMPYPINRSRFIRLKYEGYAPYVEELATRTAARG